MLQLAEQLLGDIRRPGGLLRAEPEQLKRIKGLGPAKRAEVAAVLELARRSIAAELGTRPSSIRPPRSRTTFSCSSPGAATRFAVLFLDAQSRLIGSRKCSAAR